MNEIRHPIGDYSYPGLFATEQIGERLERERALRERQAKEGGEEERPSLYSLLAEPAP